jgi:hypothetical protein
MSLEKQIVVDKIEVIESNIVQVRSATRIVENGKLISTLLHRSIIAPGDDYSTQDAKVKTVCAAVHTAEVVAAYQAAQAAAQLVAQE